MDSAVRKHGLSTEGKIRIVSDLQAPLSAINDSVARALYVQQLSERIGVPETAILAKLREPAAASATRGVPDSAAGRSDTEAIEPSVRMEQRIISMMLQFPEIISEVVTSNILSLFTHDELRAAGEAVIRFRLHSTDQLPELLEQMEDGPVKRCAAFLAIGDEAWTLKGCKSMLARFVETRQKQGAGRSIQKAIETAEREQNEPEVLRLLSEKQKMAVRREKQKMFVLRKK